MTYYCAMCPLDFGMYIKPNLHASIQIAIYHMMTSSNGNISVLLAPCEGNPPVTGEFSSQRPVTRRFDVFFDLRLNKRLSKESCAAIGWNSCNSVRAPSQYPKRRLFVRSRKVSKPRDWYFKLSYRFEIWQAHRQHCCRSACQISERSDNSKYKSRGFETLRDLTKRRLFGYWDGAQIAVVRQGPGNGLWPVDTKTEPMLTRKWGYVAFTENVSGQVFVVARSRKSLATLTLGSSKIKLLTISRLWRYCGPSNYRFNFILYWHAPWVFF